MPNIKIGALGFGLCLLYSNSWVVAGEVNSKRQIAQTPSQHCGKIQHIDCANIPGKGKNSEVCSIILREKTHDESFSFPERNDRPVFGDRAFNLALAAYTSNSNFCIGDPSAESYSAERDH